MAPELLSGEPACVRGDVYALGATLWTVLSGAPPFAALGARALGSRLAGKLPELAAPLVAGATLYAV